MMTKTIVKKGGRHRLVLPLVHKDSSFVVPAGYRIDALITEKLDANAVNLALGTSNAVLETAEFTVTGVASATVGTVNVGGVTVTLAAGDIVSAIAVANKIREVVAASTSSIWSVLPGATALVKFVAKVEGDVTNLTVANGTATNITYSAVTTSAGTLPAQVMTSVALSTAGVAKQTIVKGEFSTTAPQTVFINLSNNSASLNLYVEMAQFS
jgi:hypothetical protein